MPHSVPWLPRDLLLLDERCPLPLTGPFTTTQAREYGVSRSRLSTLVARGLVRPLLRGVYAASQVVDTIELRADALGLVIPDGAIVTDRTAAWLHGVDILPRSAVHQMPPIEVFAREGTRLRRTGVSSGTRQMRDSDVTVVGGLLATTKLRTALDLGRHLYRFDALAALDALLRAGVDRDDLLAEIPRFRGARGVVQLRWLAPLADRRAESPPESVLRLHWLDTSGMPPPEPQLWVYDGDHPRFRLDLTVPDLRYAAEYDGRAFHDEDAQPYDDDRREWLADQGWTIDVFTDEDLFRSGADPSPRLQQGIATARRRTGAWVPQGHYLRK